MPALYSICFFRTKEILTLLFSVICLYAAFLSTNLPLLRLQRSNQMYLTAFNEQRLDNVLDAVSEA